MVSSRKEYHGIGRKDSIRGFSLVELIVVVAIISVMSAASIFYLSAYQDIYKADDEALKIIDVLQEARQKSLTQREPMRVEVDLTDGVIRLIDENTTTTANDDEIVRSAVLAVAEDVRLDDRSSEINDNPPEVFPVPSAQYKVSIHPISLAHNVLTIRFLSNGTIVDAGTSVTGSNAVSVGVTLHVWSPREIGSESVQVARAITVLGSSGSMRLWEYNPSMEGSIKWQDSRRTSVFGGQQTGTPSPTPTATP